MKGGLYEAKAVRHQGNETFVVIPQIFFDQEVPLHDYLRTRPDVNERGYVGFISGDVRWPVWVGDSAVDLLEGLNTVQESADAAQSAADAAQADADTANIVANAAGSAASTAQSGVNALESNRLLLDGSNSPMTGQLSLVGDPTADAHAVRKAYVDTKYSVGLASARPTAASATGRLYYSTDTGRLEISDGNFWLLIEQISTVPNPDTSWNEISTFSGTWANHSPGTYETAAYMMDGEGWVHLKGLVKDGAEGTSVFTLPSDYIPEKTCYFPQMVGNNGLGYVAVRGQDSADAGQVQPNWYTGGSSNYNSLSGIQFPSHLATVDRTRVLGFVDRTGTIESEYGLSLFKRQNGMVVLLGIAADRTIAANLYTPSGRFAPDGAWMFPVQTTQNTHECYIQYYNTVQVGLTGTASGSYLMVAGEYGSNEITDQWIQMDPLIDWGEYTDGNMWHPLAYYKDQYGFVHLRGLAGSGASGTADIFRMPAGYLPGDSEIFATMAAAYPGLATRVDVRNDGDVQPIAGSSTQWTSIFGINYYAAA